MDLSKDSVMMSFHVPEDSRLVDVRHLVLAILQLGSVPFVFARMQDDLLVSLCNDTDEVSVLVEGRQYEINAYEIPESTEGMIPVVIEFNETNRYKRIARQSYSRLVYIPAKLTL
jgi:hypothetical protein